jgi:hypothetical protein
MDDTKMLNYIFLREQLRVKVATKVARKREPLPDFISCVTFGRLIALVGVGLIAYWTLLYLNDIFAGSEGKFNDGVWDYVLHGSTTELPAWGPGATDDDSDDLFNFDYFRARRMNANFSSGDNTTSYAASLPFTPGGVCGGTPFMLTQMNGSDTMNTTTTRTARILTVIHWTGASAIDRMYNPPDMEAGMAALAFNDSMTTLWSAMHNLTDLHARQLLEGRGPNATNATIACHAFVQRALFFDSVTDAIKNALWDGLMYIVRYVFPWLARLLVAFLWGSFLLMMWIWDNILWPVMIALAEAVGIDLPLFAERLQLGLLISLGAAIFWFFVMPLGLAIGMSLRLLKFILWPGYNALADEKKIAKATTDTDQFLLRMARDDPENLDRVLGVINVGLANGATSFNEAVSKGARSIRDAEKLIADKLQNDAAEAAEAVAKEKTADDEESGVSPASLLLSAIFFRASAAGSRPTSAVPEAEAEAGPASVSTTVTSRMSRWLDWAADTYEGVHGWVMSRMPLWCLSDTSKRISALPEGERHAATASFKVPDGL